MPDVLGPCPAWCSGIHQRADEEPQDQCHESTSLFLDTATSRGTVQSLEAMLTQYPNALEGRTDVYAIVDLGDDFYEMTTEDLEALARGLEVHAQRLRQLGQQLTEAAAEC